MEKTSDYQAQLNFNATRLTALSIALKAECDALPSLLTTYKDANYKVNDFVEGIKTLHQQLIQYSFSNDINP